MLSAVILSGGKGSRMGQEKGLALLNGVPMVELVKRTIDSVADETVISVAKNWGERYRVALGEGTVVVEDEREGQGPLAGLTSAFKVVHGEYVLVSPCDTPFLNPAVCRFIVSAAIGFDVAVPVVKNLREPLHAAYARGKSLKAFEQTLSEGKRRPLDAYPRLDVRDVDENVLTTIDPSLESFWNLNTPEDMKRAEKRFVGQ